ncbi:DUF6443 domain-containing protein [Fulvivirga ulvae]|uniref:DUF6443 domain-containing protein n=1 Tax=Fulvivirga ulvae TaxID=2904245 RepID=UPI001F4622EC|nr:DUF6443 domain-containing protein [Fulvivirga ulvae]UII31993.1 DUF6443 domain-containing protein [Fulvivirga ulvae]
MKILQNILFLLTLSFGISCASVQAQELVGESNPVGGNDAPTYTYYYETPYTLLGTPSWRVDNDGLKGIYMKGKDSRGYWVQIKWKEVTTGSVTFLVKERGDIASMNVAIQTYPAAPATPSVSSNVCGIKTLTRSNPSDPYTEWYWQTTSTGTSTSSASANEHYYVMPDATPGSKSVFLRGLKGTLWGPATQIDLSLIPDTSPGAISGPSKVCKGTSVILTDQASPAGGDGSFTYQWYYSTTGTDNWTVAPGTSNGTSYEVPSALIETEAYFKRKEISVCGEKWARFFEDTSKDYVKVIAESLPASGSLAGTHSVCGSGQIDLQFTPDQPQLRQWFKSDPGNSDWYAITPANDHLTEPAVDGAAYKVVSHNSCGSISTKSIFVTISEPSDAGFITGQQATVVNSGNVNLKLNSFNGDVVQWHMKGYGGAWQPVAGTAGQSEITVNIDRETRFKAEVSNGVCVADYAEETVFVDQIGFAGTILGEERMAGLAHNPNLILSGYSGTIVDWEYSTDGISWISMGTSQENIQHTIGVGTYYYRVKVNKLGVMGYSAIKSIVKYTAGSHLMDPSENYTREETPMIPVINHLNIENLDPAKGEKLVGTVYNDGFGRPQTSVSKNITPTFQDVIVHQTYDSEGNVRSYLPYADQGQDYYSNVGDVTAYYESNGFSESAYYYSTSSHEDAPGRRILAQSAPGKDWALNAHAVKYNYAFNLAGEVRRWGFNGISDSYYDADQLYVNILTDENGNTVRTFTDPSGKTILKQVEVDEIVEGSYSKYLETYYLYDELDRLIYTIPPKAVKLLGAGAILDVNNSAIAELIYTYAYDNEGKLTEKKVPGAAPEYIIYDQFDRVILTQDGNQRAAGQWMFVKYDELDRPVYSGVYTNTVATSRVDMQALADSEAQQEIYFEKEEISQAFHGYSNRVFPTSDLTLLGVNYYDHYDFGRDGTADYSNADVNEKLVDLKLTRGYATGGKVRILGTEEWMNSVVFYDKKGKASEIRKENHTGGIDVTSMMYSLFTERLMSVSTAHYETRDLATETPLTIKQRYTYDHVGRLDSLFQKNGNDPEQMIAHYRYNELGQQVGKDLHYRKGEGKYLQTVDYAYNIRGWLKSMNEPGIMTSEKLFGMEWIYNEQTSDPDQTPYYNGNISSVTWKDKTGKSFVKGYNYTYDKTDRLTNATFKDGLDKGNYDLNNITYDANGNIQTLTRFAEQGSVKTKVDELNYSYSAGSSNQLLSVSDAAANDTGFKDVPGNDYGYDAVGNMTADANKGITSITYNVLNKPETITFDNGTVINYIYAASGEKLAQEVYKNSTLKTRTDYIGNMLYENDTLRFFGHAEGRVVVDEFGYDYQYAYTDHLGNVRMIYTSNPDVTTFTANMEAAPNQADDDLFEGTNSTADVLATSGSSVTRLTAGQISGPALTLPVYPGDTIAMQVQGFYRGGSGTSTVDLPTLITAIAGSFGGVNGGSTSEQAVFDAFDQAINPALGGFGLQQAASGEIAAYLNYIMFDKNMQVVQHGHWPMSDDALANPELMTLEPAPIAQKEGFIYVYLTNESDSEVYFDDFEVTVKESLVVQSNEYYPFGLQFNTSWTRPTDLKNNFLYNAGSELNEETQLYSTFFRQYDAAIGRFTGIDPRAGKYASYTPYNFAFSNPISFNDPRGDDVFSDWDQIFEMVEKILESDGVGGSWDSQNGWSVFANQGEAYAAGFGYNDQHQSWTNTTYGREGSALIFAGSNGGEVMSNGNGGYNILYKTGTSYTINNSKTGEMVDFGGTQNMDLVSVGDTGQGQNSELGDWVSRGMWSINTGVGAVSTYTVGSGGYYKWNEVWHKYQTTTAWRWQTSRWNNFGAKAIRAKQVQTVAGARNLSSKLTKIGGGLIVADIALSGELKPSHAINTAMLGASTTGVGAIVAGVWFLADFGTMGVNYLINGEAKGIGDMIDESIGTYEMYEGIY